MATLHKESGIYETNEEHISSVQNERSIAPKCEYKRKKVLDPNVINGRYVYYRDKNPTFKGTRAILIANLNNEINVPYFKQILNVEALKQNSKIIRAWMNKRKTHCLVLTSSVKAAVQIRKRLHDADPFTFEHRKDGHSDVLLSIFVNYIPVRAFDTWVEQETNSPPDAIWKVGFDIVPSKKRTGTTFTRAIHLMVNYENEDIGYVTKSLLSDECNSEDPSSYSEEPFSISFLSGRKDNGSESTLSQHLPIETSIEYNDEVNSMDYKDESSMPLDGPNAQEDVFASLYFQGDPPSLHEHQAAQNTEAYYPNSEEYSHYNNHEMMNGYQYYRRPEMDGDYFSPSGDSLKRMKRYEKANCRSNKRPANNSYPRALNTMKLSLDEYDALARVKYAKGRADLYIPKYEDDE